MNHGLSNLPQQRNARRSGAASKSKFSIVCREASFNGVLMKGERKNFSTLFLLQQYVKARWQGPDYIDGPNTFHSDYCQYTVTGCSFNDLGNRNGLPGTDEYFDWTWKD